MTRELGRHVVRHSANGSNAAIISVAGQKLFTVGEKGAARKTIVFEDYGAVDLIEHPIQSRYDTVVATQILLREVTDDLARPRKSLE